MLPPYVSVSCTVGDWREQLVRIGQEHHAAATAILSKLNDGQTHWASKTKLGVKNKATVAAFEQLIQAGVLIQIGAVGRAAVFAIERGSATARMEQAERKPRATRQPKAAKQPKPAKPDDSAAVRAALLATLMASQSPWIARTKLSGTTKSTKAAYAQFVNDGAIVELGKLGDIAMVAASRGHAAQDVCRDLALEVIVARGIPGALTAMPIAAKDPFWKGTMPAKVQDSFQLALKAMLRDGKAVKLEGAGLKLFVLASSIHAAAADLAESATPTAGVSSNALGAASARRTPPIVAAHGVDTKRVREAYRALASRQRAVHVTIADLWRDSGAPLPALKSWLLAECQAHRADPAQGEPSLATPEQLAAALDIDGRPHLYIQLENA